MSDEKPISDNDGSDVRHDAFLEQYRDDLANHRFTHGKEKPTTRPSHVYLMECFGKYKIGVSDNVKRRCKQFRSRQFPVRIVAQSDVLKWAFDIEQDLHESLRDKCIGGEWFDLNEVDALHIGNLIRHLSDSFYELGL